LSDWLITRRISAMAVCRSKASFVSLHILDGDHRLVRKGLDQFDLPIGEAARLRPGHCHGAHRTAVAEHRHGQHTAVANGTRKALRQGQRGISIDVCNVN
jgi:hypothetical protein